MKSERPRCSVSPNGRCFSRDVATEQSTAKGKRSVPYDQAVIWLDPHNPQLAAKIIRVEAADHPAEGQMLEHARRFFKAAERMRAQPGSHRT